MSSSDSTAALVISLIGGSHFVNHMYFMLLPPIFGALQADLGITTGQSGLALGVVGFVVVALQLPLGYLSDAHSRTLVLGISLTFGALGAALTAATQGFASLLVAAVVTGIGLGGHHPSHYPMLAAATDPDARGRAFSIHGFTGALGFAVPPAIVGALTWLSGPSGRVGPVADWRAAIGLIAVIGALYAAGCLWIVRRRIPSSVTTAPGTTTPDRPSMQSLPSRFVSGLVSILSARAIVLLTVLWFLTSMANWGVQAYTQPLLTAGYGIPAGTANLLVSAMLTIGAVAILAGGWLSDRYGARAVILGGFGGLIAIAGALASGLLPIAAALGVTLLMASTIKAGRPALSKLGDRLSARDDLGKNFGLLTVGISGGGAVAPPVFGRLTDIGSIQIVFGSIAAIGVVAFLFTFVVLAVGDRSDTDER
ncbi:MAG: MFS transporter [Halapricum sp.]